MWIHLLSIVQDENLVQKQLLSALNNETKTAPQTPCHFNPCQISMCLMYLYVSCHEFTKKNMIARWFLKLPTPTQQQGHTASFFFKSKRRSHSLYLLFSSLSNPLSLSFYPGILTLIQIWISRYKRPTVMACFGKRKLGNWVFLCVSTEIKTQGDKATTWRRTKKVPFCC